MPAPLGPTSATVCPGAAANVRSWSTGRSGVYPNVTPSNVTAPAAGSGSGTAPGASAISGGVSSSSNSRSLAPAAPLNEV